MFCLLKGEMEEPVPQLRQWVNPSQVMSMRRVKKRQKSSVDARSPGTAVQKENACYNFGRRKEQVRNDQIKGSPFSKRAGRTCEEFSPLAKRVCLAEISCNSPDYSLQSLADASSLATATPQASSDTFPTDWSLKTRVRFTSSLPFSWAASPRAKHEAEGLAAFTRRLESSTEGFGTSSSSSFSSSSSLIQLLSCQMLWMHPSLPFPKLFPRHDAKQVAASQSSFFAQNEEMVDALRDDWISSFQSLYQLLQAGHCSHFFLCANQFTVLFLSKGTSGCPLPSALLTPTTSGLRRAMQSEGVEFSMPLADAGRSVQPSSLSSQASSQPHTPAPVSSDSIDDIDTETVTEEDTAANSWLNSMGLALNHIDTSSSSSPHGISLQRSRSFSSTDSKPSSVVRVEGPNVHALFNFVLNCKTVITSTGPHAGLPPTLLAPVAFLGGTLRSVKVKHGTAQQMVEGRLTPLHTLELSGPLLPQTIHRLCSLLRETQSGDFTAQFSTAESTVGFNLGNKEQTKGSAVSPSLLKTALRELKCSNGLYTWK